MTFEHQYYYSLVQKTFKFLIPEQKKILCYGVFDPHTIPSLKPSQVVSIADESSIKFKDYIPEQKFDYVILNIALGMTDDICELLKKIKLGCERHTRIVIHQENYMWEPFLKLAARLGLKKKENTKNWVSVSDIHSFLASSGFEPTRSFNKNILPMKLGFLGPVLNWWSCVLPIFDFLKLDQFIIARPLMQDYFTEEEIRQGVTICLTVRDEEANIAPLVKSLPELCPQQEILFVEGHSKDATVSEIKKMQAQFPEKNIRLIHQSGIGQGDAIRAGFNQAKGNIVILYEGDGTSDPSDLFYVYDCMLKGYLEFVEGSRFCYPLSSESMPFINKVGNVFFAKWFSLFLKQRTTDVLSGIKAVVKKDFKMIDQTWGRLGVQDPFGDFELLYGAVRNGLKIGEVPIHYKPRTYGDSKTSVFRHGSYLLKMAMNGYWIFRSSK